MVSKKRCASVLFALLVLLALSLTVAADEEVFNDQIKSGESIDIDDFTLIITMNKYASAIFVDAGKMFATVPLYECKKMEMFRICFDNTTFDIDENELFAEVRINRSRPDVSLTRQINQTSDLYVGNEAEITIEIINTGDPASEIIMTDTYPAGIEIYDLQGGCNQHENQVYWQGHLNEDAKKTCTFIIRATKEIHQSIAAYLKYWDGFKWEEEYTSALDLDFDPVVGFEFSIVREDYVVDGRTFDFDEEFPGINIGETLRLIVNISNNYHDDVHVENFELTLPPDLEYKSIGYLRFSFLNASGNRTSEVWYSDRISKVSNNVLHWDGYLKEKGSKLFVIELQAKKSGSQTVVMRNAVSFDDIKITDSQHISFDVADPGVAVRMTVSDKSKRFSAPERLDEEDDSITIEALHPYHFRVYAQNTNKYAYLTDVKVKVFTDLAAFPPLNYAEIDEEGQKIPYSMEIIPPNNETSREFKLNVSVWFKNSFGESHFNSTEFLITVSPTKDLTISFDSSEGEVLESHDETEITVSVDNSRLVDIKDVTVKDIIDPRLHVEGVHSQKIKLVAEEETQVYKYMLTMPEVHNTTYYNITTMVSFFDPDLKYLFNYTKTTQLTLKPLRPDLDITISYDLPETIYPGTLIPADYTLRNPSDEVVIRDITVHFPIMEVFDLLGPETFFIDHLNPGEEVRIENLVKLRPKLVSNALRTNLTYVEYYDAYGNLFNENSTDESFDVDEAGIVGPSLFLRTIVPPVINKSSYGTIKIEVLNNGTAPADVTIRQGNTVLNTSVAANSKSTVSYTVRYDTEGNYTLPDPVATFDFQGLAARTRGNGAEVSVQLLLPSLEEMPEEVPAEEPEVEEPIVEKEEVSFEEYEEELRRKQFKRLIQFSSLAFVALVILILAFFYISYQRKRLPEAPFMGGEEEGDEEGEEGEETEEDEEP